MKKLLDRKERAVLKKLNGAGYEAYYVGGCVRDAMMGRSGGDVDVTTNALPEQIKKVFAGWRTIDTGIQHGTVTVLVPEEGCGESEKDGVIPVEVTTYRSDGDYSDSRHPDQVQFLKSLEEDLARRDFTVNTMACDLEGNIIDPFGGKEDIETETLRAAGDAGRRFQEDALRIMRGLRFASVLDFEIEEKTAAAMMDSRHLLKEISAERIFAELKKLVTGKAAGKVLRNYVDVFEYVIPELYAMKGFLQHNPYHKYDVLEHCIRAMEEIRTTPENQEYMKLAALFHDVGKPDTFFMDEEGIGHFYGHPAKGEEVIHEILMRLRADRFMLERISLLVKRHDLIFKRDEVLLKKWMNRLSPEVMFELLEIKRADNVATGNMHHKLKDKFEDIRIMMEQILEEEQCFSLKDLAADGRDIIGLGVAAGPEIGLILAGLLEAVIEGRCENDKEKLLELAEKMTGYSVQ